MAGTAAWWNPAQAGLGGRAVEVGLGRRPGGPAGRAGRAGGGLGASRAGRGPWLPA